MKYAYFLIFLLLAFCQTANSQHTDKRVKPAEQRYPDGVKPSTFRHIKAGNGPVAKARIEPPFWWAGMKRKNLELLIHDTGIGTYNRATIKYEGVSVEEVSTLESPNYVFLHLSLAPNVEPGIFDIALSNGKASKTYQYELKERKRDASRVQGLTPSDFIYLIMPDRFANADASNDNFDNMAQTGIERDKMFFRHGGDLQGIIDHLDYIVDLGATAIWLNPVLENDQPYESYHGYAVTDHYQVDPRFGTNELYVKFVEACHKRGIKVVMDIIHNHVGDKHWFIKDLPAENWINQWDEFTKTTYRAPTLLDPYASEADRKTMSDGWFDHHMPDLNQGNEHLVQYLIQNNIWWVEYTGLDAYRIDTYAYPDQDFMGLWGKALQEEYPSIGLFGETWVHGAPIQAQFTQSNRLPKRFNSYLPAVTDFQMYYAINEALTKPQGWTDGVSRVYYTLAKDFLYESPYQNVIFLDNHDLSRYYSMVGEDLDKFKSGVAFLMSMRGIPMLYYGTEILMKNFADPDGKVREDFPGGWAGDKRNKFTKKGRTVKENEAFEYVKRLANYRKQQPALHNGRLMQFVPQDGIYTYFRYNDKATIMVIMNTHDKAMQVDTKRFAERTSGFSKAKDITNGESLPQISTITVPAHTTRILELVK